MKKKLLFVLLIFIPHIIFSQDEFLNILKSEVMRNAVTLKEQPVPAYYISYRIYDTEIHHLSASFGALNNKIVDNQRLFQASVRVGSHETDNTREIKTDNPYGSYANYYIGANSLPRDNKPEAIRMTLWDKTDQLYKDALKQYEAVKANVAVMVEAEDKSADFSKEKPEKYYEKPIDFKKLGLDEKQWEEKIRKYGSVFSLNKDILAADAGITVELVRKYFVDTDGAEIVENTYAFRIFIQASTTAEDGMELPLYKSYYAHDVKDLPSDEQIVADATNMSNVLSALRKAPVAESYSGPALMTAEAAGVFFHEIFGHRIEGGRLKQDSDAQTFKKKIGEKVLPDDFSIVFDPQLKKYKDIPLNGSYIFDDEGVRGQRVYIVKDGTLNAFLMSRTPIDGFPNSNGHGRGMIYFNPFTRQSNMIIESSQPKTNEQLRSLLIEDVKKDNKEYGYLFDQVAGGFTMTGRYMPNAFNVTPLIVYRVYADGRPDELVRGVDMVGTPLAIFSQIAACGNEYGAFNGYCGAESGSIPVSCVSPMLYVKMVETQKKSKSPSQPPILERP